MNANELHANISALLNGEDPDTGDEVDFDEHKTVEATTPDGKTFTVTGFKLVEGGLVLELSE